MLKILDSALLAAICPLLCGCPYPPSAGPNTLTQYGTLDALMVGVYDGDFTVGDVKRYGDFGLGTFNALDGEMVVLDGVVYGVPFDGIPVVMEDATQTPFTAVVHFQSDQTLTLDAGLDMAGANATLTNAAGSANRFYAVRLEGTFALLRTRSVPRQSMPYPPLASVIPNQSEFELAQVAATLVGLYTPDSAAGLNAAGWHWHALTDDHTAGGHVLALETGAGVTAQIDTLHTHTTFFPETEAFLEAGLDGEDDADGETAKAARLDGALF
jgi:acetolactate decarboxylase